MKQAIAVTLLSLLPVAVQDQQPARYDTSEATMGQIIYTRYCAACHGVLGKGDGPVASGLVTRPPDLTLLAKKNEGTFPFDKFARSIDGRETTRFHGTPDMPVWGEVFGKTTGTEAPNVKTAVSRITHYVWSIQQAAPAKK